jgi:hypothetical protein
MEKCHSIPNQQSQTHLTISWDAMQFPAFDLG